MRGVFAAGSCSRHNEMQKHPRLCKRFTKLAGPCDPTTGTCFLKRLEIDTPYLLVLVVFSYPFSVSLSLYPFRASFFHSSHPSPMLFLFADISSRFQLSAQHVMYCIVLYCIVLYCIVLYCDGKRVAISKRSDPYRWEHLPIGG